MLRPVRSGSVLSRTASESKSKWKSGSGEGEKCTRAFTVLRNTRVYVYIVAESESVTACSHCAPLISFEIDGYLSGHMSLKWRAETSGTPFPFGNSVGFLAG